jgi:type II secretory pathway component GspD/PulD (secretin)
MKRILFLLFASLALGCCSIGADQPGLGALDLQNADVNDVLQVYQQASGSKLIVDSRVKQGRPPVTLRASGPLAPGALLKLLEKTLLEQAAVVITPLDGRRVSVTYNDALPIRPAKTAAN